MSADRGRRNGRGRAARRRLPAAILAVPVGAALVYLGTPQLAAALLQYRAAAVLAQPAAAAPSADELANAIMRIDEADRWWAEPANSFDSGVLVMRLAAPTSGRASYDRGLLKEAERRFERSLGEAPANATAWAALADARRLEGGATTAAAAALKMSIALARYEPLLLAWRAEMGLALYSVLDDDGKAALADQVRLLGRRSVDDLVRVARSSGKIGPVITALTTDPETLSRFERQLRTVK
jgi:tetratricopeptide (TPR) repeat protein